MPTAGVPVKSIAMKKRRKAGEPAGIYQTQ